MHVVIAADKFTGSLTGAEVADAVRLGLSDVQPDIRVTVVPVADGGDGTVAAAVAAGFAEIRVEVEGPTGAAVSAPYALDGGRAVVELAAACGLELLPGGTLDPLGASTFGLGQVISDAIEHGAREIVLGLGGSASTDGGAGMTQALGARVVGVDGQEVGRGGGALAAVAAIDVAPLHDRMAGVRVQVASDVDNPLLGPRGAAAVFGPQKGADDAQIALLDSGLASWAGVVAAAVGRDDSHRPGAGAAGGNGFAALALLDAQLRPGVELILELLHFDRVVAGADLVITGEGSFDQQSLGGKTPVGVAAAAARAGVPTVAVAGRCLLDTDELRGAGIAAVYPLTDLEPDPARSMADAAALLRQVGRRIAKEWLT
jgi:glycerate 2-kinase